MEKATEELDLATDGLQGATDEPIEASADTSWPIEELWTPSDELRLVNLSTGLASEELRAAIPTEELTTPTEEP